MGRPAANSVPGDPPSTPLCDGQTLPCTGSAAPAFRRIALQVRTARMGSTGAPACPPRARGAVPTRIPKEPDTLGTLLSFLARRFFVRMADGHTLLGVAWGAAAPPFQCLACALHEQGELF